MNLTSYNRSVTLYWFVEPTDEYLVRFAAQSATVKQLKLARVLLLNESGPRPERFSAVLCFFDQRRQALLLVGADKKGKSERGFYRKRVLVERNRG